MLAPMPARLVQAQSSIAFERIDTHVHLNRAGQPMLAGLAASGWRVMSVCVSRATVPIRIRRRFA